jgi:hypothetical protein
VTFGSIDDASAPIPSSPASAPAVKPAEGVKSFGSVAVQNGVSDGTKSTVTNRPPQLSAAPSTSSQAAAAPASTPPPVPKFSIAKLFQGPSTQSVPAPPPEAASPASRSASLPSQAPGPGQPYQPPFTPGSTLRQGQNGNPSVPRSPVYSRPMPNGQSSGAGVSGRPQAGSGGPSAGPAPAALSSPRLTPHPPPGPPSGLPPPAMWSSYYVRVLLLPYPDDVSTFDISVLCYSITPNSSLVYLPSNFINHNGPATSSHLNTSHLRPIIRRARPLHPLVCLCHQETHLYHYNRYQAPLPNHMPSHRFSILLTHLLPTLHPPSPHPRLRLLLPTVQHHLVPTLVLSSQRRFRSKMLLDKRLISTH